MSKMKVNKEGKIEQLQTRKWMVTVWGGKRYTEDLGIVLNGEEVHNPIDSGR